MIDLGFFPVLKGNGLVTGLAVSVAIEGIVIGIGIIYCIRTRESQKKCNKSKKCQVYSIKPTKIPKDCLDSHAEDNIAIYHTAEGVDIQTSSQYLVADNDFDDIRNIIDSEETTVKRLRPYI